MNFIQFETAQKLRGGFYTDADIAEFLTRWVGVLRPQRVLEPSCGDGAFLEALRKCGGARLKSVFACEINPEEAAKAKARRGTARVDVHVGDFLRWFLFNAGQVEAFDGALGNPPFIRYQYLPEEQQLLAERVFKRFGLPFTKHANAWVPFVIAALALLRPGGRLGMVVPSEVLHIPHAQSLRRFLAEQCSRILILDPEEIWFGETLQGTVLLMAEKKYERAERSQGVAVVPVRGRQQLAGDPEAMFQGGRLHQWQHDRGEVDAGISDAGGASAGFGTAGGQASATVQRAGERGRGDRDWREQVFPRAGHRLWRSYRLQRWAHPMFGRSEHVQGLVYSRADHAANKRAGLPANFLWFQEESVEDLPANVRRYLEVGSGGEIANSIQVPGANALV